MVREKNRKRQSGIYYQDNPSVIDRTSTAGITLVALVVTIVVLLILAGITIMYVIGDNSIFRKAQDAKNKTNQVIRDEQEYFNNIDNVTNQYITGNGEGNNSTDKESLKKGEIVKEDKKEYIDENGEKAPIPGGFCVVKDSDEDKTDKNTVREGLVISDISEDDLDNNRHGNQFVWVPVNDYDKFHLIEGYFNGNIDKMLGIVTNPSREAGDTTKAGSPGKPNVANSTAGSSESIAMYKSVKENGGFYIARFEAGIPGTTVSTLTNDANKQIQDGTVKPVSQKGVGVWNYIPWGGTVAVEASDGLPGNDNANGAVKVARSMYKNDEIHKVTSTLCYGVQWDAALNFIDSNYENGTSTGYVKDSDGKGHYNASLPVITGYKIDYQQKHIYDMAGNLYEWTMEAYSTNNRVYRGGRYMGTPIRDPASFRYYNNPSFSFEGTGFRVALYM